MEPTKKKNTNLLQSVADRLSRLLRKDELTEETRNEATDAVSPEVQEKVDDAATGTNAPVARAEAQTGQRTGKADRETPQQVRRPDVHRKRTWIRRVSAGPLNRDKAETIIPISDLPRDQVGPAIHDFVVAHLSDEELDVDMMAMRLKISRTGLYTLVRREFGVTPANYILDLRLKHAASLLETGLKVREVSLKCGFSDPKYFGKVFKRYYGILPSCYGTMQATQDQEQADAEESI